MSRSALAIGLGVALVQGARADAGSTRERGQPLRGAYDIGCTATSLCAPQPTQAIGGPLVLSPEPSTPNTNSTSVPANCPALQAAGIASPECGATLNSSSPAIDKSIATGSIGQAVEERDHATRLDWRVGLKGGYTSRDGVGLWQTGVDASASVETRWRGGAARLGGQGGLNVDQNGSVTLGTTAVTGAITDTLAKELSGEISGNLNVGQEARTGTITQPASMIDLGAEAKINKGFGHFSAGLFAGIGRELWSASGHDDGSWTDNGYKSWTGLYAGAEAGLRLSPIFRVEGRGVSERLSYDAVDPGSGAFRDGYRHELRGTLRGEWPLGLSASAYLGYALRTFDSGAFTESGAWIYGAAASYKLVRGGTVSATFDNAFAAPATSGTAPAQSDRSATVTLAYPLTPQWGARANLGGSWTSYPGSTDWSESYSAGVGLDWTLARNMTMSADYSFGLTQTPLERHETHTVSAGVSVSR